VDLSVVIPTLNRRDILLGSLERISCYAEPDETEIVVVDNGSSDGSAGAARAFAGTARCTVVVAEERKPGAAAARNKGLSLANGGACLFLGDDIMPTPSLLGEHLAFHREKPELEAAMLGRVEWAPEIASSEFMQWCSPLHAGYDEIRDPERVPGSFFFTSNVSAKTAFLLQAGGFDESFPHAAFEDVELGLRLEQAGMQLEYRAEALANHVHAIDLAGEMARMRIVGRSALILRRRFPEWPEPRHPDWRHRAKAAALTFLNRTPLRRRLHARTWEFLCHEAYREAYWGIEPAESEALSIGAPLARMARRDPASATAAASA
jgi:glycosyltransferase involved in cell wall biosynthesis